LLGHPYFALSPPKSTGRETFNLEWLRDSLSGSEAAVDVQATLLELTASTIARALEVHCPSAEEIYVCGGGARNAALLSRLQALLPEQAVAATDVLGIDAEWVEALAFAWLAQRALKRECGNVPAVTGAAGARVIGAIYPR
jgi:anhydro-N-acetylmuramic acid kinase